MGRIIFKNPKESTHRVPTNCLPPKASRSLKIKFSFRDWFNWLHKEANIGGIDYIERPRLHIDHYAKVKAERERLGMIVY
jgi:hypothetical protein